MIEISKLKSINSPNKHSVLHILFLCSTTMIILSHLSPAIYEIFYLHHY
jgi:hypothetical protein